MIDSITWVKSVFLPSGQALTSVLCPWSDQFPECYWKSDPPFLRNLSCEGEERGIKSSQAPRQIIFQEPWFKIAVVQPRGGVSQIDPIHFQAVETWSRAEGIDERSSYVICGSIWGWALLSTFASCWFIWVSWTVVWLAAFTCWSTCNWQAVVGVGAAGCWTHSGPLGCLPGLLPTGSSRLWGLPLCWTSHEGLSSEGQNILMEPKVWSEREKWKLCNFSLP